MKKTLFFILLLNFAFICSTFAQDEEKIKYAYPTSKQIINLFENLKNQLKTESNFNKIEYKFIEEKFSNNTVWIRDTLNKDLYFVKYTLMSKEQDILYNSQFLLYKSELLTFNCMFSYYYEENITQEIKTDSANEIVELNQEWKHLSYQRTFPQNVEKYRKINSKIIINHKSKKAANETDKAVDFLINQESVNFNYSPYSLFIDDFKKAFEHISFLINNKQVKALEKLLYTVNVEGKALAAGAILYLQKNEKIQFSKETQERVNYILENEEVIYIWTGGCGFSVTYDWFLAKDFETLFEKFGIKDSQRKSTNDVQER
ncbi:hypothetical protein Fleli_0667 [Bernardetia litoralis DSM 6794]|uniref:Uncharacterized protein n=1 Tax=Bernardetia litoralis (strain ATCC 23117 / DSM 6794 / NBRC 15988 / NCIMB 1366 / Fx l1 / Sio-4) TaxID=880071 RepID=I4AGP5_BERLS|nr:hypothetical protein [Bernardetia litoralis]AFM03130.1 hypothetical protein Fleli_0667 [Bernardetia litoralis DSM 6794]